MKAIIIVSSLFVKSMLVSVEAKAALQKKEKEYAVYLTINEWNEVYVIHSKSRHDHDRVLYIDDRIFKQIEKQIDTTKK